MMAANYKPFRPLPSSKAQKGGHRMSCYHCGGATAPDTKFCPKCGAAMTFTEELLAAGRQNDEKALETLYYLTCNNVYHTLKSMIRDEDTVLDLVQDTYIKAFNSLAQLEKKGINNMRSFSALYLFTLFVVYGLPCSVIFGLLSLVQSHTEVKICKDNQVYRTYWDAEDRLFKAIPNAVLLGRSHFTDDFGKVTAYYNRLAARGYC